MLKLTLILTLLTPYLLYGNNFWSSREVVAYEKNKDRLVRVYGANSKSRVMESIEFRDDGTELRITSAYKNNKRYESYEVIQRTIPGNKVTSGQEDMAIIIGDGIMWVGGSDVSFKKEVSEYLSYKRFLLDQAISKVIHRVGAKLGEESPFDMSSSGKIPERNPYVVSTDTEKMIQFYSHYLGQSRSMASSLRQHRTHKERASLKSYVSDARKHHKRLTDSIRESQLAISEANNQVLAFGEKIRAEEILSEVERMRSRIKAGYSFYSGKVRLSTKEKTQLITETLSHVKYGLTSEGAALVGRLFAYVKPSEIPSAIYDYVDRSGVLKGEFFHEGQFVPLGKGTEVENSLTVANELQVVVDELFSFEDEPVEQNKAFMALMTLNLANLEFGSGTELGNKRGYEYLKLAKSLVKDLGSFGGGIGKELYGEIRETIGAIVDIGSLSYSGFQSLINDPEGSAKIAESAFLYLLENYQKLGEKALLGTGKMLEAEFERKGDQLRSPEGIGEVTGEVLLFAGTLGIGKALKAGVVGTRSTLDFIKKIIKRLPEDKLVNVLVRVKGVSETSSRIVDSARKLGIKTKHRLQIFTEYLRSTDSNLSVVNFNSVVQNLGKNGFILVDKGSIIRKINLLPSTNSKWGLTGKHLRKHFYGESKFALNKIDSAGNADKWKNHLAELFNSPVGSTTSNGMLDVVKQFPKADGSGTFKMGIRLKDNLDGTFDLVTVLTKQ